jgi:23S rRNA (guanosine2251-2'-O)-methyltransferase
MAEVIHGIHAVDEALRAGNRVNRLYLAKDAKVRDRQRLVDLARTQGVPYDFVPLAKLNELASTPEHQGVAASISPVAYADLEAFLAECPPKATVLGLDGVQHPKNLGMLIRTAAGAGAAAVVVSARKGALLDESVARASAGTVFHVPVIAAAKLPDALRRLRDAGFWIYGLDAAGRESVFEMAWADRCVLVMGNETKGMRSPVRNVCDALVRIPLARDLDSLNVAVAAGIALFQVASAGMRS